jgi:hypothetical protein
MTCAIGKSLEIKAESKMTAPNYLHIANYGQNGNRDPYPNFTFAELGKMSVLKRGDSRVLLMIPSTVDSIPR